MEQEQGLGLQKEYRKQYAVKDNPFAETTKVLSEREYIAKVEHDKVKTICKYVLAATIIICIAACFSDYVKFTSH